MAFRFFGLFGSSGPQAQTMTTAAGSTGAVATLSRLLGSASTFSLVSGNSNLTVSGATIQAAAALGAGASQQAVVREYDSATSRAVEYPVTITTPGTAPSPALTLAGPLSYATSTAAGALVANIGNVPSGATPTITPNDGRLVVAGNQANGWTIVVGMTASSAGTISLAVAAPGASGASATVTVAAPAGTALPSGLVNRLMAWDIPAQTDGSTVASMTDSAGGVFAASAGAPKYRTGGLGGKPYVSAANGDRLVLPTASGAGANLKALIASGTFTVITFVEQVVNTGNSIGAVLGSYDSSGTMMLCANGQRAGFYYGTDGGDGNGSTGAFTYPWSSSGMLSIGQVSNAAYPFQTSSGSEALTRLYLNGGCVYSGTKQSIALGDGLGLFGIQNGYSQGNFAGRWYGHMFFNGALSPAQMKQAHQWGCEQLSQTTPWAAAGKTYALGVNSLDDGYPANGGIEFSPMSIAAISMGLPLGCWDNLGVSGQTAQGFARNVSLMADIPTVTGKPHRVILGEYYNARWGGTGGGQSPQAIADSLASSMAAMKSTSGLTKVALETPPTSGSDNSDSHANYDAFIAALLAKPADAFARIDQDPNIGRAGDPTNVTYYQSDGIHLTGTTGTSGYRVKGGILANAFAALA